MADCRFCGVANDDDSKEWYVCGSCNDEILWKERAEKAEAENAKLRAALFCKVCGGLGVLLYWDEEGRPELCPACSPIREELRSAPNG